MSFSKQAYEKSESILSEYRRQAAELAVKRTEEIYTEIPEIKEIDDRMTELGAEMTRMAIKGDAEKIIEENSVKLDELKSKKDAVLKSHGFPSDYMTNVHRCGLCGDTGYVGGFLCDCRKKIMSVYDLAELNLSDNCGFDNFKLDLYSDEYDEHYKCSPRSHMKHIFEYCKSYAADFSGDSENILMYGKVGLGKTFLCGCIASELAKKGFSVVFKSAYDIFEIISKNKFNYKADYSEDVDRLYSCDLLIMDDLGTEFLTEYTHTALFDIIERRLVSKRPTVINFNLAPKDVETRYSDRIMSRLLTFRHLLFLGDDIRARTLR